MSAVAAFALESLPERTGFSVGAETRHDAYASVRMHHHGVVMGYENAQIGCSFTGATGYGSITAPGVRTESQYFGIAGAYRVLTVRDIAVGLTGELSTTPPFNEALVPQNVVGVLVPRGAVEAKAGLIAQARPMKNLSVYTGPMMLWIDGPVHEKSVGGFIGAKYKIFDRLAVVGDVVGAGRLHYSAAVTYHF